MLSALFSFSFAFAETGTEVNPTSSTKNTQLDCKSFYIAGDFIPSGSGKQWGTMANSGLKLRTNQLSNTLTFTVNKPYTIKKIVLDGYANDAGVDASIPGIKVTKVEVDGVEATFTGGEFPVSGDQTSAKLTIDNINAAENITLTFDNSNVTKTSQIVVSWSVDWERPDATQPTITVSPKALSLIPGGAAKVSAKVDPNTFTTVWASDKEAVATVAEDGTVTAVAAGVANIINRWDSDATVADTAVITVVDFDVAQYEIVKQFDFTTMGDVTLTIESEAAGKIWNAGNKVANDVFFCTNEGLEDIAVQAVLSGGKGWSITEAGLTLGSSAGRCAAIGHLKAGQIVEIIYTGSQFFTGSKEDATMKDDGAVKTALNEGIGRAIYKMEEDGMLGFEIATGKAIEKIIVYEEPEGPDAEIVTVDDKQYKVVGENIITNGSFDDGVAGWYAGAWAAADASNYTLATEGGFDGGAYLQYSAGGVGSEKNIRGKWDVEIGKTYLFRCYTSGQKPTDANLQYSVLRIYDESLANYEGAALYQLKWGDADVWTENNFVFTATSNAVTFRSSWTENTKLDGFMLVEVERYFSPEGYNTALETAKNTLADENYAVVTGEERTTLANTIETYTNATADKYQEAIEALDAATNAFIAAAPAYQALADAKFDIQMVGYDVRFPYATEAKKGAAQATLNAVAKTAAEATTMTAAIYKAYRQFAESHAMAEGVEGAVNMTDAITNPKAESAIAEPWKVVLGAGSGGSLAVKNAEPWTDGDDNSTHNYFDGGNWGANAWDVTMKQDITLPAGKYLMTVKSRASDGVMFSLFAANDTTGMPALGASGCLFNRGWNDTSLEFEVKEAGTVNIGVQGVADTQHQWMSFSDFRLVQLEATAPEFEPAYGTLWTEEQGSQVDENEFNYITLENKYFKGLVKEGDTIKVAISHVGNQPSSRARIITEGTLNLTIDNAGESKTIQQDMTSADLVLDADEIANIQKGANVVLSWKNMTVAQVDLIEKVEAVKTDYTDYIANADLTDSENKGWDDAGTKGIDGSGIVKASTGATFNFSQTIANLPAGKYKLTAQAAYRYSGSEADEYAAMQTDAITKFAQLYATVGTKNTNALVQNRYDGASDTDLAGEGAVQVNNLWVPNSSNAVKAWFAAGKYVNEVEFNLPADGDVKIGIVKTASPEAGDYTVIGPWTLTRLGDAEEEPEPETIKPGDDVTKFIVNNSFETGDLTGWTVGSSSDTGVKPNSNGTYTTEGCDGDYLFNTWWQGIPITQTITNLPKGKYELKALMANDAITAGNKPCLYLLANGDHSEAFSSPNAGTFAEGTMEFYVTDGTATIGAIGGNADGSFTEAGYYWYKVDNFRLTFVEALPNIDDIEIPEGKMSNAAAQAIADAKAAGDVVALLEAVKVAKASIEAYAHLNGVLNELTDILEKTNVYTAEAKQTFDTAFNTAQTGYNDGTISDADAKAFNYGSRLEGLLPSLLLSAYTSTVNGTPYINTWSVEGNNDGTNYLTPFFEYWVGDAESLAENTITATMTNLQNGVYDVTAWVRVRIKNGAEAPATGIFLQANDSEGVSVVGENVTGQLYLKEVAAQAVVESGELKIKFNVAAENNISWLAFKNVKFAYNEKATVGIKNVNNAKNANDAIYNLNGQKVEKAQKGLYIINGKKVVIK